MRLIYVFLDPTGVFFDDTTGALFWHNSAGGTDIFSTTNNVPTHVTSTNLFGMSPFLLINNKLTLTLVMIDGRAGTFCLTSTGILVYSNFSTTVYGFTFNGVASLPTLLYAVSDYPDILFLGTIEDMVYLGHYDRLSVVRAKGLFETGSLTETFSTFS
jgi:hypothetical protein